MNPDAPEFHTKSSTPISPLPLHPPEPSKIPVLQNQIDPVFNMTSTHIGQTTISDPAPTTTDTLSNASAVAANEELDAAESGSFSDPFDDADKPGDESTGQAEVQAAVNANANADDDSDDYAMTFESDAEEEASKQEPSDNNPPGEDLSTSSALETAEQAIPPEEPTDTTAAVGAPPSQLDSTSQLATIDAAPPVVAAADISNQAQSIPSTDVTSEDIDIQQLLDNITANAELNSSNANNANSQPANANNANYPPIPPNLSAHAGLPPRPQVAQTSAMNPAYAAQEYQTGPPGYPPASISSYRPPGAPGSFIASGAPGTLTDSRNTLLPPPPASFTPASSGATGPVPNSSPYVQGQRVPSYDRTGKPVDYSEASEDAEVQWSPAVQKLYDEFLADERMYVSEGLWDRFPNGSRLFIGNLPTEKVSKRDLFNIFHPYGRLAQISIKQAYGFVQFHDTAACHTALEREQGQEVRGRKMHLEISKPQKNTRGGGSNAASGQAASRRSRSPDRRRGGRGNRGGQDGGRNNDYDRYDARSGMPPRDDDFRAGARGRDDYRPGRSPSPPRGGYRGRDEYAGNRGRDFYDSRDRRRSRSRSPYDRRDGARYRDRSPSPRREAEEDFELKIPRRDPRDVPDVHIILMDELDRAFVAWVEGEIRSRGVKTEVMFLSPRLPLAAVIRRQIIEGVIAVAQLDRRSQDTNKIPLQVFDRKGGANNVRFDEYQDLEPRIAAELVVRAKQQSQPATAPPVYGQPQYGANQPYQAPPAAAAAAAAPNLANLVGQLDNATLQKLLSTLNTATPAQQQAPQVDLAGILGGLGQHQQQQQQQAPPMPNYPTQAQPPQFSQAPAPNLASLFSGNTAAPQPGGAQSAQQVQNIMAQLAKFRQ